MEGSHDGNSGATEGVCLERGVMQRKTLGEDFSVQLINVKKCQIYAVEANKLFKPMSGDIFHVQGALLS